MGVGEHLKVLEDWALSLECRRGLEPQDQVSGVYGALRLGRIT
jgi:hypothetical protein